MSTSNYAVCQFLQLALLAEDVYEQASIQLTSIQLALLFAHSGIGSRPLGQAVWLSKASLRMCRPLLKS